MAVVLSNDVVNGSKLRETLLQEAGIQCVVNVRLLKEEMKATRSAKTMLERHLIMYYVQVHQSSVARTPFCSCCETAVLRTVLAIQCYGTVRVHYVKGHGTVLYVRTGT